MHRCVCDCILEAVQNAIEADATSVTLSIAQKNGMLSVGVADNGRGMSAETLKKATDPFYTQDGKHPGRRVGLGLPFLIQQVEAAGGSFTITSEVGSGTTVAFSYDLSNFDAPPLGDVPSSTVSAMSFVGDYELILERGNEAESYRVARSELKEALGELMSARSLKLAREYIQSLEESLFQSRGEHGC